MLILLWIIITIEERLYILFKEFVICFLINYERLGNIDYEEYECEHYKWR